MSRRRARIGFIPLVDAAVLVAARELDFAAAEGVELELCRETSWSNIRDKVAFGLFEGAHMLAPLPIAMRLGLGSVAHEAVAPFVLNVNGNAISVSRELAAAMDGAAVRDEASATLQVLERLGAGVRELHRLRGAPLAFGVPFPFSCHAYELRHCLAHAGLASGREVEIVVVPPPLMVDALRAGKLDGFCVGEPWSSVAVDAELAEIVLPGARIWQFAPEKVLGLRREWAESNRETLFALLRALHKAAVWADRRENHVTLSEILAREAYLDLPAEIIERALNGRLTLSPGGRQGLFEDFLVLQRKAATFPWRSFALWIYAQMIRAGQVTHSPERLAAAQQVFRPDLYREALGPAGVDLPGASEKVEGALAGETPVASSGGKLFLGPDRFFDGTVFDPKDLEAYLAAARATGEGHDDAS
ncbi:MAG: CmpA/NrtA family ABC transporter substrate-binding protein [Kiloniellaceae bacterium]